MILRALSPDALATLSSDQPTLSMATWLTGFPPCLGYELTSTPLTGRGGGRQGTRLSLCCVSTLPTRQDNGLDSASSHSCGGWGGMRRGTGTGRGSGWRDHLGHCLLHLAWVFWSSLMSGLKRRRRKEETVFPHSLDPSLPGRQQPLLSLVLVSSR